jgi:hypothetical protein
MRLEGVVLGRDLVVVEAAEEGDLLQDIGLDARNAVEEEDGEDAGGGTEGGADGTPVFAFVVSDRVDLLSRRVCGFREGLHPDESAGGEAAELELGDFVARSTFGSVHVSLRCAWKGEFFAVAYLGPYWLLNDLYGWRVRHCWTPWWPEDLRPYISCYCVSADAPEFRG